MADEEAIDSTLTDRERDVVVTVLARAYPEHEEARELLEGAGLERLMRPLLGSLADGGVRMWRRLLELAEQDEDRGALPWLVLVELAVDVDSEHLGIVAIGRRLGLIGEQADRAYGYRERSEYEATYYDDGWRGSDRMMEERSSRREAALAMELLRLEARQDDYMAVLGASEERTLDVEIEGSIESGAVTAYATIGLAGTDVEDAYRSEPFAAGPSIVAVVIATCTGFEARNETVADVRLELGRPSATVAFRFAVLPDGPYAITVAVHQSGRELVRVLVDDFTASPPAAALDPSRPPVDVYVSAADDGTVTLLTADLSHRFSRFDTELLAAPKARTRLDYFVARVLAAADLPPDELERELRIVGMEIGRTLPAAVREVLTRRPGQSVLIDHPGHLDFPFELALLEFEDGDGFLGERHAVTRWISPSPAPPVTGPSITEVALLTGDEYLAGAGNELAAHAACLAALAQFGDLPTARQQVFQQDRFRLVDLVTHLESRDGSAGLRFGSGILRPGDFLPEDRAFGPNTSLLFVNACSSTQVAERFYSGTSFPLAFIGLGVRSVVATVLPVEPALALDFGTSLLEALQEQGNLGEALCLARHAFVAVARSDDERARRRLAAASYCGFGHPDLAITFAR